VFYAFSLVLSNKAYIYLSVSYLQMLKAFTPVAVLIVSYISGLEQSSMLEMGIVTIICCGVAITSVGELNFSWIGFIFQALAIVFESSRLVLTNILMKQLKLDPLSSLYYIAPLCLCFILPAHFYFEFSLLPWDVMMTSKFAGMMAASGAVAFSLNVAVVVLISNTSALTLTLAGIIKDLLLVFLSVMVFGSPVTLLQYFGYAITLFALNLHKEYKKSPEKAVIAVHSMCPCCPSWCT
jgi:drug/metabolite transporter (DMT)-like permease